MKTTIYDDKISACIDLMFLQRQDLRDFIKSFGVPKSILDVKVYCVNRIFTPKIHRGLGYASSLLKKLIADADDEHTALLLWINPYGDLDYAQLEAWYMRNGFKKYPDFAEETTAIYVRMPNSIE